MEALVAMDVQYQGEHRALWRLADSKEPLAKDLDVAAWLGFERPRNVRKLIERHAPSLGSLCSTVEQTGGRPARVYFLTEEQALYLAAKSDTPNAVAVLKMMVAVFLDARLQAERRRGRLLPAAGAEKPPAPVKARGGRRPRAAGRLAIQLRAAEKSYLLAELRKHHGHNTRTAEALGISRRALYDKMRDYGLDGEAASMRTEAGIMGPRRVEIDVLEDGTVTRPARQLPAKRQHTLLM